MVSNKKRIVIYVTDVEKIIGCNRRLALNLLKRIREFYKKEKFLTVYDLAEYLSVTPSFVQKNLADKIR